MKKIIALLIILSLSMSVCPISFAANTEIYSTSFEIGIDNWTYFNPTSKYYTKFSDSCSSDGYNSLYINDESTEYAIGITSPYFEIEPNKTYTALVNGYSLSGSIMMFVKYFDANKKQISNKSTGIASKTWKDIAYTSVAPSNAKYILVNLCTTTDKKAQGYFDNFRIYEGTVTADTEVSGTYSEGEEILFTFDETITGNPVSLFSDGFESGMSSWDYLSIMDMLNVKTSTSQAYRGTTSLYIKDSSSSANYGAETSKFNVEPGSIYSLYGYGMVTSGTGASMYLKFFKEDGASLTSYSKTVTSSSWDLLTLSYPAPENASYCIAQLVSSSSTKGDTYFDNISLYKGISQASAPEKIFLSPSQANPVDAKIVAPVNDKLVYDEYNDKGDKLADYSIAGFHAGKYNLPETENLPVVATLEPSGGLNDQEIIQAAINAAETHDGSMNVVKLKAGKYYIGYDGIKMKSGVVLSGEGQGPTGTILFAYVPYQYKPVQFRGTAPTEDKNVAYITDEYVKAGSNTFNISADDAKNFSVGDKIIIRHTSTEEWAEAIGMKGVISVYDQDTTWTPGTVDHIIERTITAINGTKVTVNYAVFMPFLTNYVPTYITKIDDSGRIQNAGIENLRILSNYNGDSKDEDHATTAIYTINAKNIFLRDITAKHFYMGLFNSGKYSSQITIQNCSCIYPVSTISGSRRYSFYASAGSQQILGAGLYSNDARHDYATNGAVAGAVVYLDSIVDSSHTSTENHAYFASGVLYDNIYHIGNDSQSHIAFANRGIYGTAKSQGWTSVSSVAWNCLANSIIVHKPPLSYQNFSIGVYGVYKDDTAASKKAGNIASYKKMYRIGGNTNHTEANFATDENTSFVGDAFREADYTPVNPRSLFKAQLSERYTGIISNAKPNAPIITYPKYDGFFDNGAVEIAGLAQIGANKVKVYIDDEAYETTVSSDNTYRVYANLADGVHKIYATQIIDGMEGNKTADRFITVNKENGNPDYLQSNYSKSAYSLLLNDTRKTYDEYIESLNLPDTLPPVTVFGSYIPADDPMVIVNHRDKKQTITGHYRAVAARAELLEEYDAYEYGVEVAPDGENFNIKADSKVKLSQGGGYGILFFNLMPSTKYYIRPYVMYKAEDGEMHKVTGEKSEFTTGNEEN